MVAEFSGVSFEHISLLGLILSLYVAIPFIEETGLHLNVKHLVFVAVVLTRVTSQLRLAVVELQLVSHLGRQLTYNLVTTEQVLTVHHHAYGLVVPVEFAVTALHTWQFLDKLVKACSLFQLECFGIKHNGVARHRNARHLCRHLHLLQHKRRRLQLYDAKVCGVLHLRTVGIVHLARILISDHAEREHHAALRTRIENEASGAVCLTAALNRPSWLRVNLTAYSRSNKYLARLGVHYLALERVGITDSRLHKSEQQYNK